MVMSNFIAQCMAPMGLCQIDRLYRIADSEYDLIPDNPDKVQVEIMEQCLAEMAEAACQIGEWMA
jgi:hypothetical protein